MIRGAEETVKAATIPGLYMMILKEVYSSLMLELVSQILPEFVPPGQRDR